MWLSRRFVLLALIFYLAFLELSLFPVGVMARSAPEVVWSRTFGAPDDDFSESVVQTVDGDYIIVGGTSAFGAGRCDVSLVKTDSEGEMLWNRTFGGSDDDEGWSVHETNDGGYIIAGRTFSFGAGGCDIYLVKVDSDGNEEWSNNFGGSDYDFSQSVEQTVDGGYIVAGSTFSFGAGGCDMYLVKVDSDGNEEWNSTFGGSGDEYGVSVEQALNGDYIVAGTTDSFGVGDYDVYLVNIVRIYELRVLSKFGSVSGEGVYTGGSTASFEISPTMISGDIGVRYIFIDWNSNSSGGYTGSHNPATVVIDNNVSETAEWKTQYLLIVTSPYDLEGEKVDGGGWYNESDVATLSAESSRGFLVRRVFKGWIGDVESSSETVSLEMNEPKNVYAEWRTDYSQAVFLGAGTVAIAVFQWRRQARVRWKKKLIIEIKGASEAVSLSSLAEKFRVSEADIKRAIDKALEETVLEGKYARDWKVFITDDALKRRIKSHLET